MTQSGGDQAAGLRALCGTAGAPLLALHVVGGAPAVAQGTASAVLQLGLQAGTLMLLDGRGPAGKRLPAQLRAGSPAALSVALVDRHFVWLPLHAAHHLVLSEASARGAHEAFSRFALLAQTGAARLLSAVYNARDRDDAQRFAGELGGLVAQRLGVAPTWLGQLEAPGFGARLAGWLQPPPPSAAGAAA